MAAIPEDVLFEAKCQNLTLVTNPTSDTIKLIGLALSKEQAASIAWLINHEVDTVLEVEIKVK